MHCLGVAKCVCAKLLSSWVQVVSKNKHERRKAAQEAEGLLVEERLNFEAWRDSLETVPTIKVSR